MTRLLDRVLAASLAICLLACACVSSTEPLPVTPTSSPAAEGTPAATQGPPGGDGLVETVTYDEADVAWQQEQVDQGHTPGRLDPDDTAMSYLAAHYPDFGGVEEAPQHLQEEENAMVLLRVESEGRAYLVTLEKLARQDDMGIWFVTRVEIPAD